MKRFSLFTFRFLFTGALLLAAATACSIRPDRIPDSGKSTTIESRAENARKFAGRKGLNEHYCLLLDYGIPSGTPRLFVWSFTESKVVYSAYAMHGPGRGSTDRTPVFSNDYGSKCSSVGRFEVTKLRGNKIRTGFRLKGLDRSNSRSLARGIMLHGSKWVDRNKRHRFIPLNEKSCQGCVTVSTKDMDYIGRLVRNEKDHLLLWSYYEEVRDDPGHRTAMFTFSRKKHF